MRNLPDVNYLRECVSYDEETGFLFWRSRPLHHFKNAPSCNAWNARYAGARAFNCPTRDGHVQGRIDRVFYGAHRVVWKLSMGSDPGIIDHINGNPSDNRIENLREVCAVLNGRNRRKIENSHPYPGVSKQKSGRWLARIRLHRRDLNLGTYDTAAEAITARKRSEQENGFIVRGVDHL